MDVSVRPLLRSVMSSTPLLRSTRTKASLGEARADCWPLTVEATTKLAPALQEAGPPAVGEEQGLLVAAEAAWTDVWLMPWSYWCCQWLPCTDSSIAAVPACL